MDMQKSRDNQLPIKCSKCFTGFFSPTLEGLTCLMCGFTRSVELSTQITEEAYENTLILEDLMRQDNAAKRYYAL